MRLFTFIFLLAISTGSHAGLTGKNRDEFVNNFYGSCFKNQTSSSVNAGISKDTIRSYCSCMAYQVADRLTPDQTIKLIEPMSKGQTPAWLTQIINQGATYCMQNLSKYK